MEEEISLLNKVEDIHQTFKKRNNTKGQDFNIFSFLRKETDEVGVHSKFLAFLLDTSETHECGSLFLELFLKTLKIKNYNTNGTRAIVEGYIGPVSKDFSQGGSIDILLKNKSGDLIKIENKIDAHEQPKQLIRYHNYISKGTLIFLTKTGYNSRDHEELEQLGIEYKTCSYQKEIVSWLEECLKQDVPIYIEKIIHHYKNLIFKLTGQNNNYKMDKKISEEILSNKTTFEAYQLLMGAEANIKELAMQNTILPILHRIAEKLNLELSYVQKEMCKTQPKYLAFYYYHKILSKNNLCLSFQFDNNNANGLYFGFYQVNEKYNPEELPNYLKEVRKEFENTYGPSRIGESYLCYSYYNDYYNWNNLDTLKRMLFGEFENDFTFLIEQLLAMTKIDE